MVLAKIEDVPATTHDPLEEANLLIDEKPSSSLLPLNLRQKFIELLKEFKDYFAWDYGKIPELSRRLVKHHLPIKLD